MVLDCPTWRFGPNCEQECHCADISEACDSILGICSSGCAQGWEGYNCQTRKSLAFFITFILHARNISVFYPETSEVSHPITRTIFKEHLTSERRDVTCKGRFFLRQRPHAFGWKAIWMLQKWRVKNKLSETFKSMESVSFGLNRKRLSDGKFLLFLFFVFFLLRELSENAILSRIRFWILCNALSRCMTDFHDSWQRKPV